MKNDYFLSYLVKNKFILYFSKIKGMRKNGKKKLFFVNGKFI